jgi:hypothetical protein
MAKIIDDIVVVKLSRLVRDKDEFPPQLLNNQLRERIEEAIQQIVDASIVVEVDLKD